VVSALSPDAWAGAARLTKIRVLAKGAEKMQSLKLFNSMMVLLIVVCLSGCSNTPSKSPDVADNVRKSLEQANLKDVSVSQDRDKGVVTLTGTTASDSDKVQAESIAKSIAGSQVVANEIAVRPPTDASTAKKVESDTDTAIEKNLHAVLVKNRLDHSVKYAVKNGVVTLSGTVNSQSKRGEVEKMATKVPNVQQVVNELEVKNQKASSSS
jgi:hyperosmotically inducible periplasmic protein